MWVRLDALLALSAAADLRRRTGRWPASLGELVSAAQLAPEEVRHLPLAALEERDGRLVLRAPLDRVGEGDPDVLELSVGAP